MNEIDMCLDCFIKLKRNCAERNGHYEVGDRFVLPKMIVAESTTFGSSSKIIHYKNVEAVITEVFNDQHMLRFDGHTLIANKSYLDELQIKASQ